MSWKKISSHTSDIHSVAVDVSLHSEVELHRLDIGVRVNGTCYCDVFLLRQLLTALWFKNLENLA